MEAGSLPLDDNITSVNVKDEVNANDTANLRENSKTNQLLYGIEDTPAWYSCCALGLQHYLLAVSSLIGLPLIVAPHLCIPNDEDGDIARALLIGSLCFVSGIITLLQTTFGTRLPILQGGTISYLPPTLAILMLPHNQCPSRLPPGFMNSSVTLYNDTDGTIVDGNELWQRRMREVQGAIAVASLLQIVLGFTGAIGFILRFMGPLTVAPVVSLIGLSLFSVAANNASVQWGIAMFTAAVLTICSQYLPNICIPIPLFSIKKRKCFIAKIPFFKMYPVLIALVSGWILCLIFTVTDVFPNDRSSTSFRARTDFRSNVIENSPWFYWPYPGQWGLPRVTVAGVVGMFAGVIAGLVESIGDYYACARLSGAPIPPKHAINRGVLVEGFGCVLAGLIGTGTATTSYSGNVAAIGITRVGSRRVLQVAGGVMIFLGVFSKFGSICSTIPDPVIGGMLCVTFGMISAVGISNLQHVDLNSTRNLFIVGTAMFMGLTVPEWMKANPGIIQTNSAVGNQIITVLLQTPMIVGGFIAFFLDNTVAGTDEERGIKAWLQVQDDQQLDDQASQEREDKCYDLPFPTGCCRLSRYVPFLPEFGKPSKQL